MQSTRKTLLTSLSALRRTPTMSTAPNPTSSKHDGSVYFWNPDGTWQEFLSQWYACSFAEKDAAATSEGAGQDEKKTIHYRTTEMYMMYQKAVLFSDAETARKILGKHARAEIGKPSARDAASLGPPPR